MKVIDLFAGCGGFSTGFMQAGFNISKAVEFDSSIANTYQINHPTTKTIVADIGTIDNEHYFSENECDVIIGGPPCQGFSMAGARIRGGFVDDPRNYLFKHYFNIVKIVKPKMFIIENVKGILTMSKGAIFSEIVKLFSDPNNFGGDRYYVHHKVVKASNFGIPQARERVIIIGVKNKDFDIEKEFKTTREKIEKYIPSYFNNTTVWEAISNIPSPTLTGECEALPAESDYQKYLYSKNPILHNNTATNHSKVAIERMKKISQGENWTSLDEEIHSVHSGAYGRLQKDGISPTITTRFDTPSGGKFIHPVENRTLTPREAARIQSFPDDFIFYGKKSSICKQVGNAVPPKIAYFLANLTRRFLNENSK
ncbi:MAG: DNA cytosine methyltransferase [Clostridia bacterium]|nr:DNA cytosine methyltransferase [Clostridia bacterium]